MINPTSDASETTELLTLELSDRELSQARGGLSRDELNEQIREAQRRQQQVEAMRNAANRQFQATQQKESQLMQIIFGFVKTTAEMRSTSRPLV